MIAPDLEELLALRGAAQGLRLPSRRPAHALHAGAHRSAHRGRGLEFQEVRPYVSGDDPRTIDWRVTARRGRPHTKLFREERERPVWLLADLSAAMFFGTRRQLKSSVVARAAALIAWSAALAGDRVGAVVAGTTTGNVTGTAAKAGTVAANGTAVDAVSGGQSYRIVPPRAREAGVLPLLAALIDMQPKAPPAAQRTTPAASQSTAPAASRPATPPASQPTGPAASLSAEHSDSVREGLGALAPLVHPGSLVIALSDFATLDSSAAASWAALAVHNDVRLFWVTDPLEREGLPNGRFRIGLPGGSVSLDGSSTRAAWTAKWRERETRLEELANQLATPVIRLDTSQPVEEALRSVLSGRRTAA